LQNIRYNVFTPNTLSCKIKLDKDNNKAEITPSLEDWYAEMTAINPNILKELDTAIALRTNKIGKSRKNDKLLIFEGPDDPVLVDNKIALDSYID